MTAADLTARRRAARPRAARLTERLRVQVEPSMSAAIDAEQRRLAARAGRPVSRSAAVRALLVRCLAAPADDAWAAGYADGYRHAIHRARGAAVALLAGLRAENEPATIEDAEAGQ